LGCEIVPRGSEDALDDFGFTEVECEFLSQVEHGRWVVERLFSGWRYGETKDVAARKSPYLVRWEELPEQVREYDREAVRAIPEVLRGANLVVRRVAD